MDKASITAVTGIRAIDKVYDGTVDVTLDTSGTVLHGLVEGDELFLATATGTFEREQAGARKVHITNLSLDGADAGNYILVADSSSTTATIERARLTLGDVRIADKLFDGTNEAQVENFGTLVGVLAGDDVRLDTSGVVAWFVDQIPGEDLPVLVTGYSLLGTDAGNYVLTGLPTTTKASIRILPEPPSLPFLQVLRFGPFTETSASAMGLIEGAQPVPVCFAERDMIGRRIGLCEE